MTELEKKLRAISDNQIKLDELEKAFDEVAEELLSKSELVAGDKSYNIKEIEFYFYSKHYNHEDNYTHKRERQSEFGEWYFHRLKDVKNYNHTRRGVDITFGNKENSGGILIRGIENVKTRAIYKGPSNVVGAIVEKINLKGLELISKERERYVFNKASPLKIIPKDADPYKTLKTKRTGLSDEYPEFVGKPYRYFKDLDVNYKCNDKENVLKELEGK